VNQQRYAVSVNSPQLASAFRNHPLVDSVATNAYLPVEYAIGPWRRTIRIGDPSAECTGLVEIADNNPWVCADLVNVPSPAVTVALIALAPLAVAGLIADEPVIQISEDLNRDELQTELERVGYAGEFILDTVAQDLGSVIAATVMVPVVTPTDPRELDGAFDERYGRAFFIREDADSVWATTLVADGPRAVYRLRYTPDDHLSLLTVQVMADRHGKAGTSQVVHAFNIMNGLEESLGIAE
jgi:N-acetyl-gamma-glutamylphosphate reductase